MSKRGIVVADGARRIRAKLSAGGQRLVKEAAAKFGYAIAYDNDYEDSAQKVMAVAQPYTMTTRPRLYALWQAVRYVNQRGVEGSITECGVWRGGSMLAVARTLLDIGVSDRDLYLFDTFEGMTSPSELDVDALGQRATDLLTNATEVDATIKAYAPLENVRRLISSTGYPEERVHYVVGDVLRTLPDKAPPRIAVLRLDTDWYASTLHELRCLWDLLAVGGILVIDDYGYWAGARTAVDEFFAERNIIPYLSRVDSSCRAIVKV